MTGIPASEILALTLEHVELVLIAIGVAAAIGLPAAVALTRRPTARRWALGFANIAQTIPSLALFGFLVPLVGIGKTTAIIALCLYALLPILRNALTGILGVDRAVLESAVAMGMTPRQILWQVEAPLAVPSIIAGLRIATVTTIGTATIAAAIGGGGLGVFIFRGLAMFDKTTVLAGAAPAAVLALVADEGLEWIEQKIVACLSLLLAGCARPERIVVASKNFTEQVLLGEILAQQIERRLGVPVERKLNLGGTMLAHEALVKGDIDLYPEYTGTALTAVLKQPPVRDPAAALEQARSGYRAQWQLEWLRPLGFNDTFAMIVRGETARDNHWKTLSEAAAGQAWRMGVGYEFKQRPDGLDGLLKTYGLRLQGDPVSMDLGLLYAALGSRKVDMIAANSTDGLIAAMDVAVLADDRHYFPPYECAVVARAQTLARYPQLRAALEELSGKLPDEVMRQLNQEVDGKHRSVRVVAAEFLGAR